MRRGHILFPSGPSQGPEQCRAKHQARPCWEDRSHPKKKQLQCQGLTRGTFSSRGRAPEQATLRHLAPVCSGSSGRAALNCHCEEHPHLQMEGRAMPLSESHWEGSQGAHSAQTSALRLIHHCRCPHEEDRQAEAPRASGEPVCGRRTVSFSGHFSFPISGPCATQVIKTQINAPRGQEHHPCSLLPCGQGPETPTLPSLAFLSPPFAYMNQRELNTAL